MPEQLTLAQQIENTTIVNDFDLPAADDPQVLERVGPLGDDGVAGSVKLDLSRRGDALGGAGGKRIERRILPQEAGDLG